LPTTNSDGTPLTDLASFRIYYSNSGTPCPGPFVFQMASPTATPQANQSATFKLTGLKNGTTYFVAVTAVDFGGNESACSTAVAAAARSSFVVSPGGPMNFGGVALGAFADQTFTVQNIIGGTVSGAVSVPAPFSVVSGSPFNLVGLNATQTVTVRFRPTTVATATANVVITADGDTISQTASGIGTGAATLTNLTANRAAPQSPGSTITFTATATSGTAPYQFKWWLFDGTTWAIARDWSTSNTFAWTPSTPNPNSAVGVWVRSAGETADQPSGSFANPAGSMTIAFPIQATFASLTGLTSNLAAPQVAGLHHHVHAPPRLPVPRPISSSGGSGTVRPWTVARDWSTSSTFAWTPSTPNPNSAVGVWVRSAGETADQPSGSFTNPAGSMSIAFPIQASLPTLDQSDCEPRRAPTTRPPRHVHDSRDWWPRPLSVQVVGLGRRHLDRAEGLVHQRNRSPGLRDGQNSNSAVGVWVRNAGDTADQPSGSFANTGGTKAIPFPIQVSLPILTGLTANLAAPQPPGLPVTFTTAATGGVAPYQFKWWISDGATWTVLRDWSTGSTVIWTPSRTNPNSAVGVWVRNAGDAADQPSGSFANTGGYTSIPFPID
jgi:hypothetical protein